MKDKLEALLELLRHFGFNTPDSMPEEYGQACRDIYEDLKKIINDSDE